MTESEAKTKWCPMVRYGGQSSNRDGDITGDDKFAGTRCTASACMMWRTYFTEGFTQGYGSDAVFVAGHYNNGYCGLAGKPGGE